MKQTIFILKFFLLTTLYASAQHTATSNSASRLHEIIDSLKNTVNQKWIRQNPELTATKPSFFNKNNESKYFIGLLEISGQSIPYTWDCNLSLLNFILTFENETIIEKGVSVDTIFKGTKITWRNVINGLVWFNNKEYKVTANNWHLFNFTDCPGTIIFPFLSFNKVIDIPNAATSNIHGLTILPFNKNIKIKTIETTLTTLNGNKIKGVCYDLDNDDIFDVFSYSEAVDETTNYLRLYINVSGQWKCKWINLDEACL